MIWAQLMHISTQEQFADASSSCYFLLGDVISIFSQSPPLPFISPVITTLGLFFVKKVFYFFKSQSKVRNAEKDQGHCLFRNKLETNAYLKDEENSLYIFGNNCNENYKQNLMGVKMKKGQTLSWQDFTNKTCFFTNKQGYCRMNRSFLDKNFPL